MTVTYPDGTTLEALLLTSTPLTSREPVLRVAIAGRNEVREFTCIDGAWLTEDGRQVQLQYSRQNDQPASAPEESHFTVSATMARQFMDTLMHGPEGQKTDTFYVFSTQKGRVRVTVLHETGPGLIGGRLEPA